MSTEEECELQAGTFGGNWTQCDWDVCDIPCPGDTNDDGTVGIDDLLAVIGAWGTSDAAADFNEDGTVSVEDLLILIGAWGACSG
jgi:hypothetical protein